MVNHYLNSLKDKNGMSWADISSASRVPEATVRKIFSGETKNPSFDTVLQLVISMGGSINELVSGACPNSAEAPSNPTEKAKNVDIMRNSHHEICRGLSGECHMIASLTASYEGRIQDIKQVFEERLVNARALKDAHINDLHNDKKILAIALGSLLAFLLLIIILDLSIGTRGWIQY